MSNGRIPDPLDSASQEALRSLLADRGAKAAAEALDVPSATLMRAAAGAPVRRATATLIRMGLARQEGAAK